MAIYEDAKILRMFKETHPHIEDNHIEIVSEANEDEKCVWYLRHNTRAWGYTLAELTFMYITRNW